MTAVEIDQTGEMAGGLPTGTVTFLLTDVEGSTRLWETRPDETGAAIARHYEILDEAIIAAGGHRPQEQGEGDSVVAAFAVAADTVRAALDAQLRLRTELAWLPVRIALHCGDAQLRDEANYMGRGIIRAARLRACGHGGQVLVSESTATLARDDLPPAASLIELGSARLRDLGSERVWQLAHPELPDSFPPLRALEVTPNNVPMSASSLIGRDREVDTIAGLLHTTRVVTLTGPGGCGKTRLAQACALATLEHFPGGVWWADLAPVANAADVVERVSAAARSSALGADPLAQLVGQLRARDAVLLCIDNAEHVVDAVAELVATVVAGAANVTVLVTSREPLGVPGETVVRVASLAAPPLGALVNVTALDGFDAVRLFVERARQARPNLVVDARSAPHIATICARLDGLPLALELAAARARAMPLDRLAAGLDDAFRLLTGGSRGAVARQQTLLASIAWSVDLLDESDRVVLFRLAVFQAPFVLDAAEAVAADGEVVHDHDVLDAIERLVDKSLVQFDEETDRYQLLETIRQYSFDRLRGTAELAAARTRHCRWYADWCEQVGRGEHGLLFNPSHPHLPDVLAAFDWAFDESPSDAYRMSSGLGWARSALGHYAHLARELDWVAGRDDTDDPVGWARAASGLLCNGMVVMMRPDIATLAERATALLPSEETAAIRRLDVATAFAPMVVADAGPIDEQLAGAIADDDALGFCGCAGMSGFVASQLGHFDTVRRIAVQLEYFLARHGDRLDARSLAYPYVLLELLERGHTGDLVELRHRGGTPEPTMMATLRIVECFVADALDPALLSELTTMAAGMDEPLVNWSTSIAERALAARQRGDLPTAVELMIEAVGGYEFSPVLGSYLYRWLVLWSLAAGRRDLVDEPVERFVADARRVENAPFAVARARQFEALVARYDGRRDDVRRHAHDMLTLSVANGFALSAIDALELVAETDADPARAARLFAASAFERDRFGYVARMLPDPAAVDELVDRLRDEQPDAWEQGGALTIAEAAEYAQRWRGERGRPTHGWDSLTPTERKVIELVADGASNDDVARRLVMSPATVKTHLTHVYAKTATANRTELAARWRDAGGT